MQHANPDNIQIGVSNPYKFNGSVTGDVEGMKAAGLGMEEVTDHGLNIYHAFYRTYDPVIGRMMQIDPMAEDPGLISMTPYNAFLNNPTLYTDPNGDRIRVSRDFDTRGQRKDFKQSYKQARSHLKSNGVGQIVRSLRMNKTKVTLASTKGGSATNTDPSSRTIYWSPDLGMETENGTVLSPTTILNHEADHMLQSIEEPLEFQMDSRAENDDYKNLEERRVIDGSEQETALALGEIGEGQVTRRSHSSPEAAPPQEKGHSSRSGQSKYSRLCSGQLTRNI